MRFVVAVLFGVKTGTFVRRLVTGPFSPTNKVDYCDRESGDPEDDD